ncbi:MSH2 protein [Malassezia furfur]|uniref:MSH2 protein n=1 Tax=Malassezia furfur TaxID=55194 RepID=A0ABY8EQM4_MALFU|nr:MSH2 protein [Malassezia furfur]
MSGFMYPTEEARRDKADGGTCGAHVASESSFVAFFASLPSAVPGTVRLFDRQDFYTVHGQDALFVADTVFKTQSVLKYLGKKGDNGGLPSCTLSVSAAKSFLRDALTAKQLRIEIWSPNEGSGRRSGAWQISKQASPGNLQDVEDLLFLNADVVSNPIVLALRVKAQDGLNTVGVAFADATNREMGVAEYAENDLFSNTESLLIQLGVKECLLPADETQTDYDLAKLRAVVDRCGCILSDVKKSTFHTKSIEQDLRQLVKGAGAAPPEFEHKIALSSAAALLAYLNLLADESNLGQFTLRTHDLSEYLRLDHAALRALSLFPEQTGSAASTNRNTSVFGLLNHCKTAQGTRMLHQWLKQPLVSVPAIENRQALVEIFFEDVEARHALQDTYLKYMPDMLRISKRFQRRAATLEDVVRCYQAVVRIPDLIATLDALASTPLFQSTFVAPLRDLNQHLGKLVEMVEMTIDLEELAHHNYVIKPDFDESLGTIKTQLGQVRDQLDEQHALAGQDLGLDTEKKLHLENHTSYGYCFRVTRTDAGVLKNRKGYMDLGTVKGGVYFTTSALRDLNDEHRMLSDSYARTQSRLVKDVIDIACTSSAHSPSLVHAAARAVQRGARAPRRGDQPRARRAQRADPVYQAADGRARLGPRAARVAAPVPRGAGRGALYPQRCTDAPGQVRLPARHRPQHGRQVDLPAPDRHRDAPRTDRELCAGGRRRARARVRLHPRARRRGRQPAEGRQHVHGRDARDRHDPQDGVARLARADRRAGARHVDVRRLRPRVGHLGVDRDAHPCQVRVCDALPRADQPGIRAAQRAEPACRRPRRAARRRLALRQGHHAPVQGGARRERPELRDPDRRAGRLPGERHPSREAQGRGARGRPGARRRARRRVRGRDERGPRARRPVPRRVGRPLRQARTHRRRRRGTRGAPGVHARVRRKDSRKCTYAPLTQPWTAKVLQNF